jgi:AraC-like DNA-binding protein
MTRKAWDILEAGAPDAYARALAALREDTRTYWHECMTGPPNDGLAYTPNADMPSPDHLALAANQIDLGRLEGVRRAVRSHLHSLSLGPDMLCRLLATSRSQLYRLLEGEGGVTRYIQRQRLLEGHAALCDAASTKTIAAIAAELCFADGSGFSRAFRHEFGMSPRDVRAAFLAGLAPAAVPKTGFGLESRKLGDCLRSL